MKAPSQVSIGQEKFATFDQQLAISREEYKIGSLLIQKVNWKSNGLYQILSNDEIADDLELPNHSRYAIFIIYIIFAISGVGQVNSVEIQYIMLTVA